MALKVLLTAHILIFIQLTESQQIPHYLQIHLEEYKRSLEEATREVLQQNADEFSDQPYDDDDDRPEPFQMPFDFMHSFRPNTGVGNREDLIIDKVIEFPMYGDESFSKWRYFRFNNLDYVLAMDSAKILMWKKNINVSQPVEFSKHDAFFAYAAGTTGPISDAIIFVKNIKNKESLYVAILSENKASFISIYEISGDKSSVATAFSLPFSTFIKEAEPSNKLTFLESKHGSALVILVSNTEQLAVFYRQSGSGILDNYIEVHFPSAVDIASFTVGGNGYIVVANATNCNVFKMDEFAQSHILFERINFERPILDLEHFRLGFNTYLMISAFEYQIIYVWKSSGFFEHQSLFIPNVQQSFGIFLPNCRDDIVLLFVKHIQSPDFYVWNGQQEKFIPASTELQAEFMPVPGSFASFSYGSTAFVTYVDVYGNSKLIAIQTHLNTVPDPVLLVGNEISNLMQQVQETIDQQDETVKLMQSVLASAVRPTGSQHFTSTQIFNSLRSTQDAIAQVSINANNIQWEGSQINLEDYLAGTKSLEDSISHLERNLDELERLLPDVVKVDEDAIITGTKLFLGNVFGSSIVTQTLDAQTVDGVNLPLLQKEIYRVDKASTIRGNLIFEKPLNVLGDLKVGSTVSGISINSQVMTTVGSQVSNANMSFENKLTIHGDLALSGNINGIDIGNEVVTLSGTHDVTGHKNFQSAIIATDLTSEFIDEIDINHLFNQALTISTDQNITGTKQFTSSMYTRNVTLLGTLNNYELNQLVDNIIRIDVPSTITGHKTFLEDVQIQGSLTVGGKLDGLSIPDDLFLLDRPNLVTGHKEFIGAVEANDVDVHGTVNGLNLPSDIVQLSSEDTINGTVYFTDGLTVKKDIIVHGLVDGVDIAELERQTLKLEDLSFIDNAVFKGPVTVSGNLDVRGLVNGVSLKDILNDIVYKYEDNVVIQAPKSFSTVIADNVQLKGKINGYKLDQDFMTVDGDQIIYGTKVFKMPVTFQDISTGDNMIGGVNISRLYQNRITLSIEDELSGDLDFVNHLIIDGNLTIDGTFGGLSFPQDFVLKSSDQVISNKIFSGEVNIGNMDVLGNINVVDTFGNVNLQDFIQGRVTLSTDQDIVGDMLLGNVSSERVEIDGLINGVDIVKFSDSVMSLTKDQVVTGSKVFPGITSFGSVTTEQGINGIDLSDVNNRALKLSSDNDINADLIFDDVMHFKNLEVDGLINGVNLTTLDQDSVKKDGIHYVSGTAVFHDGFHVEGDIHANSVNSLNLPEDIMTLNTEQLITGTYTLQNTTINGDLYINGHMNGIDLSDVAPQIIKKDFVNVIESDVVFSEPIVVSENIEVTGLVNGIDLKLLEKSVMKTTGNQDVVGHKILRGNITVYGDVNVTTVNGVLWTEFLDDVVRVDVPQTISGQKFFLTDLEVYGDIFVSESAKIDNINGVNLKAFVEDAVFVDQPSNITGTKAFANPVEITGDFNADHINNLNLASDVVTLQCGDEVPQVITGEKTFENLIVYGDVSVADGVNGFRLDMLAANTLSLTKDQNITGHKRFTEPVAFLSNVHPSTVNGMILSEELVTLKTPQEINGHITFRDALKLDKDLQVQGFVNGNNLHSIAAQTVYVDTEQTIEGSFSIGHAVVQAPVFIEGTVNNINLNDFGQNVSNFFLQQNHDLQTLEDEASGQCQIVQDIYSNFKYSYYVLNGFDQYQVINSSADMVKVVSPNDFSLISIKTTEKIAVVNYFNWDLQTSKYEFHDTEQSSIVEQKVYDFNGHRLVINIGVDPQASSITLDDTNLTSISQDFIFGDVLIRDSTATVSLLYNRSSGCEVYKITLMDSVTVSMMDKLKVRGATSVVLFEMSGLLYMAISCKLTPYAQESSKVYVLSNKWSLVQNIPASASSKVIHFVYEGFHYLAFTNVVPIFESKETQAIQVYRNTASNNVPFTMFQKIPFDNAETLDVFTFGGVPEFFLTVSNKSSVHIFLLAGESGFVTNYVLYGQCITDVKPIVMDTEIYLVVGQNNKDLDELQSSHVYKGLTQGSKLSKRLNSCS